MFFETRQFDQTVDDFLDLGFRFSAQPQAVADIMFDIHFRKKRVRLKDHADAALAGRQIRDIFAVQRDAPRIGFFESGDDSQNRRFARTRRAEKHDRFAFFDVKINVFQNDRLAEFFA